jgi:methionine synthase II (cobalamin-independent)
MIAAPASISTSRKQQGGAMSARTIYLVGSVPMASTQDVFEKVSAALGSALLTLPDGETGERLDWITWLEPVFADHPAFELSNETFQLHGLAARHRRYRLKPGASIDDVRFDNLFYADVAKRSYATFAALKRAGKIPAHVKFQVDLVPAHSVIWLFVQEDLQRAVDSIYNDAVLREIDKIAADIPHEDLAIQFDIASAVFARLERNQPGPYGATKEEMQETFSRIVVRLAEHVPADIDLLFHFCYGDAGHRHVVEPTDMSDMVDYANRLAIQLKRPITQIHMPVPRNRTDDAYFAPLDRLRLHPDTRVCLGLVHYTDGIEGTKKRISVARRFLRDFGIATECGFGRRDPSTIPELLRIHHEAARLA